MTSAVATDWRTDVTHNVSIIKQLYEELTFRIPFSIASSSDPSKMFYGNDLLPELIINAINIVCENGNYEELINLLYEIRTAGADEFENDGFFSCALLGSQDIIDSVKVHIAFIVGFLKGKFGKELFFAPWEPINVWQSFADDYNCQVIMLMPAFRFIDEESRAVPTEKKGPTPPAIWIDRAREMLLSANTDIESLASSIMTYNSA